MLLLNFHHYQFLIKNTRGIILFVHSSTRLQILCCFQILSTINFSSNIPEVLFYSSTLSTQSSLPFQQNIYCFIVPINFHRRVAHKQTLTQSISRSITICLRINRSFLLKYEQHRWRSKKNDCCYIWKTCIEFIYFDIASYVVNKGEYWKRTSVSFQFR